MQEYRGWGLASDCIYLLAVFPIQRIGSGRNEPTQKDRAW